VVARPTSRGSRAIGALWYAGHPIKGYNIVTLFILGVALVYMLSKVEVEERA